MKRVKRMKTVKSVIGIKLRLCDNTGYEARHKICCEICYRRISPTLRLDEFESEFGEKKEKKITSKRCK